ncbi:adenylate/guanylate cyclase domain-containing protein [Dongia rigui]|uniref:Adenylate/guanylate cyclase domain-containing protein n=1 Tax=Dongia rigui TaxID=940149 RepID=A0ABU5DZN7_9PROT|nr:adenylate/guanylate cyclase domain-containing protein [Dongia rigui]MDY0872390.1 adenylate/guanylate cyclase domain-containing protein [Dongia rigui]
MARVSDNQALRFPIWLVLAATFGGLAALAVALVAIAINIRAYDNTYDLLNLFADREITNLEKALRSELDPALEQVRYLSDLIATGRVTAGDNQRIADLLMGSLAASPQLTAVTFIREDLTVITAARQLEGRLYASQVMSGVATPRFRMALNRGSVASEPIWDQPIFLPQLEKPVMSALAPARYKRKVVGVFAAVVSLPAISENLKDRAGPQATPFVIGTNGAVFSHRELFTGDFHLSEKRPLPRFNEINDPVLAQYDPSKAVRVTPPERSSFQEQEVRVGDSKFFLIFKEIPNLLNQPLTVGVYFRSTLVEGVIDQLLRTLYWAGIVIVIAIVLAMALGRRIGHPIRELADATRHLAELDFAGAASLTRSRFREIDIANNAYNSMRNGLGWFSTYVPGSLVPHLMRPEGSAMLASREVPVTVMFTDIIGFSGIAQRLSPRRLAAFLNRHFTLLGSHIVAEGGSIDKYIGDSIMAFWGAPEAQEDHALRAVHAAQRIAARLDADNARRARKGLAPVRIRIGIHSGTVIAGNIGAPGRINYTLVGDAVNIAQRLEQFGKQVDDGKRSALISISADTAKLLTPETQLTALGHEVLPGRRDETEIYRLG